MLEELKKDLCDDPKFRIRRKPAVKQEFFKYVSAHMKKFGFNGKTDGDFETVTNLIYGNEKADVYLMAHYDTLKNNLTMRPILALSGSTSYIINFIFAAILLVILGLAVLFTVPPDYRIIVFFLVIAVWILPNFLFTNKNNYNNNTSGCMALINIAKLLDEKYPGLKDKVCFVFTDKKESGSSGAYKFSKYLKRQITKDEYAKKILINFDCVGGIDKKMCVFTNIKKTGLKLGKDLAENYDKKVEVRRQLLLSSDYTPFMEMSSVTLMSASRAVIPLFLYVKHVRTNKDNFLNLQMISDYCDMVVQYLSKTLSN